MYEIVGSIKEKIRIISIMHALNHLSEHKSSPFSAKSYVIDLSK